ncbi:UDP-glucuronosyltransferase, putative [Ricinus communis]|uniref:UDP-glucuronosyltransferase, putative n=1 Tax=Ricinus communis TaxID=3988 RepID=B9S398_RICCO|nr:UDP-glucuronosyltransferase, putative [Ricinus communis]|eukprot:XP_002520467.1 UDP-glucose iridoid glucosyltransferase [Ricinus communis]
MEDQRKKHLRLVLVPSPFQGHINPMLQLGGILYSKGLSIIVAHTKFNYPNPSNHPEFNFLSIPDGLSDHDISSPDKIGLVLKLNANCEKPFQDCMVKLMQQQEIQGEVACIIYDEISYFSETAANNLKIPSIIFRTYNAITFLVRTSATYQLRSQCQIPLPDPSSHEPAPEHPFLRLKDLPTPSSGSLENYFKLLAAAINIRRSKAIICNTMNCLEETSLAQLKQQTPIPIFAIGPLHKIVPVSRSSLIEEDINCISWLEKQTTNSVIYISIGSLATIQEKDLAEMAWGLANSKQPFLWVIRPGSIDNSDWIEALPEGFKESVGERGCIVKWAPQKEVLAHQAVGGFWSHCGWNSTLESLCEGVPMICRPSFGDQKVNARFVSHVWKVGLQLEDELERAEIERAVKRLMVDEEGKEMRQRAMHLKEMAESEIIEGGSSYNSLKDLVEFISSSV